MTDLIRIFTERGDLAHLALLLWAVAASSAFLFTPRELAADRTVLWDRVAGAPFLMLNEKREATGYALVEGGDRLG